MKDPILLAGVVLAFGCFCARRSPVSITLHASVLARASWLLACTMADGAWERRGRWNECLDAAWRRR